MNLTMSEGRSNVGTTNRKGKQMEITQFGEYTVYSDAMSGRVVHKGKVVKTFKGETAWSDAERWAEDKHFAELYS